MDYIKFRFHSAIKNSPKKYLEQNFSPCKFPWEVLGASNFDYNKNKEEIDRKMRKYSSKYPVLSPVQIVHQKQNFHKGSQSPGFSREIFFIHNIKRPIMENESILFKLIDSSGKILNQAFSIYDIRKSLLKSPDKFTIKRIVSSEKKLGITFYNVVIEQFPRKMIFKIKKSDIKHFRISSNNN